ncbi:hypothetical protein EB796_002018 [Bugula neritina]|uniref:Uncharacterized protein n=1 Tax=Bugula neritina TaxID=10212 RepID=A0A7J7KNK5_BUGNE|nr:hypothetical protein EB796_002018 [Bugula neritina]
MCKCICCYQVFCELFPLYKDITEVQTALQCKLSPNKIGIYQWSPLHEASNYGYIDIVKLLLKYGGNPNLPDKHLCNTAVHYAAQEGHPTCLRLLIEAGGDYSITNFDGYTALDLATRACERVIEKKRVTQLVKMPLTEAIKDAKQEILRKELETKPSLSGSISPQPTGTTNSDTRSQFMKNRRENILKAWSPQINQSDPGTMGNLHMSFEYNSKKSYLKVRLWKLTGLMFSATHSAKVSTLYIKARFLPDVHHDTKRKSEEVRVSPLLGTEAKQSKSQTYVTESGAEAIFEPIKFKFTKPLVYEPINNDTIQDKVIYFQVMVKQKYTHRTFQIADMTIPLNVAVSKIVKESFPLRISSQTKLPDNMMVLPDIKPTMVTVSDPNLRSTGGGEVLLNLPVNNPRPSSDVNLREVISMSSHSASVSIDMPSDVEVETTNECLSQVKVQPTSSSVPDDTVIPMPGAPDLPAEGDLDTVRVDALNLPPNKRESQLSSAQSIETVVRILSDSESDSSTDNQSKLSKMLKTKRSSDQVVEMGSRSCLSPSGHQADNELATVAYLNESLAFTRHKLRRKYPTNWTSTTGAKQLSKGSDVAVTIGDLELSDFDEPVKVHKSYKNTEEFTV